MRIAKLLFSVLLFGALARAQTTATISGTVKNLGTGNVSSGTFLRLWLRGCAGNQPRVNGVGIIAPSQGGVYFFDIPVAAGGVISGTVYATRDSTGLLGGSLECGGSTTSVWYGLQLFTNGKAGPEMPIQAKAGSTIDPSNITPITTNPVVTAPTGDNTYLRLDAGNSPVTGNVTLNAALNVNGTSSLSGTQITGGNTLTASGPVTTQSINGDLWIGSGSGQYASMAACYAALPAGGGTCNGYGPGGSLTD